MAKAKQGIFDDAYASPIMRTITQDNYMDVINPHELSTDELWDLMGDMRALEKFGKKMAGFIRETLGKSALEELEFAAPHYNVKIVERSRAGGLDSARIKDEMGMQFMEKYSKDDTSYMEVRMTRIPS